MYTSGNDNNGFYDDYLSRTNETWKEFSIADATSIGLQPKYKGHCWICPLGCIYVPSHHPNLLDIHSHLDIISNRGFHPIFKRKACTYNTKVDQVYKQTWFELSPEKIHELKSVSTIATFEILSILE